MMKVGNTNWECNLDRYRYRPGSDELHTDESFNTFLEETPCLLALVKEFGLNKDLTS